MKRSDLVAVQRKKLAAYYLDKKARGTTMKEIIAGVQEDLNIFSTRTIYKYLKEEGVL